MKNVEKVFLSFPPPSSGFESMDFGYRNAVNPPQGVLAIFASLLRNRLPDVEIVAIPDQKISGDVHEWAGVEDYSRGAGGAGVIGISCWFHNQLRALELAELLKGENPSSKVILGGPNVSSPRVARLILERCGCVDGVATGYGESTLLALAAGEDLENVPGLCCRNGNGVVSANPSVDFGLDQIPLWDFTNIGGFQDLLLRYDSRSRLYVPDQPRIGISSLRGCKKTAEGIGGGCKGPCTFCTSSRPKLELMAPDKFWQQVVHLYKTHGIQDLLVTDDIFVTDIVRLEEFRSSREKYEKDLPANLQLRAYLYPSSLFPKNDDLDSCEDLARRTVSILREIGVKHVFMGIETFDRDVSEKNNKDFFGYDQIFRTVALLREAGISVSIALLFGLPGETINSVRNNINLATGLLREFGVEEYDSPGISRMDVSLATPLVGSVWFQRLLQDCGVVRSYKEETGNELSREITPDFEALRRICIQHQCELSVREVYAAVEEMDGIARQYLEQGMVGGFCRV